MSQSSSPADATRGPFAQGPQDQFEPIAEQPRKVSVGSTTSEASLGLPAGGQVKEMMQDRIAREESLGEEEESEEIIRAEQEQAGPAAAMDLERQISSHVEQSPSDHNTHAALREADGPEEIVEDNMPANAAERRRLRKELLGEKLKVVFGLDEREEVLEEMRCWLLRSVSKCFSNDK
jgi:sterol 3beta-glucosyltransferase